MLVAQAHPDRLGETLRRVAPVLKLLLKDLADEVSPHATVGVLQDYASLPQKPYATADLKPRFTLGLTSRA